MELDQVESTDESRGQFQPGRHLNRQEKSGSKALLLIIALLLVLLSGIAIFNAGSIYTKGLLAQQYKMLDARVLKLEDQFQTFGIRKLALMEYEIDGAKKTTLAEIPGGRVMKAGEATVVFCNPQHSDEAVLSQEIDYDSVIMLGGYGLFVFCFGAFMLLRLRKNKSN